MTLAKQDGTTKFSTEQVEATRRAKEIIDDITTHLRSRTRACCRLSEFFEQGYDKHLRRADGSFVGDKTEQYFLKAFKDNVSEAEFTYMRQRGQCLRLLEGKGRPFTICEGLTPGATRPLGKLLESHTDRLPEACEHAAELAMDSAVKKAENVARFKHREPYPIKGTPKPTQHQVRTVVDAILAKGDEPKKPKERQHKRSTEKPAEHENVTVVIPDDDEPPLIYVPSDPLKAIVTLISQIDARLDDYGDKKPRAGDMRLKLNELRKVAAATLMARDQSQGVLSCE